MAGVLMLARQGQNEGDALDRFNGQCDYRLTHLGCLEAQGIAKQIAGSSIAVDLIFAPPSRQSEQSVGLIVKALGVRISTFFDDALRERDAGDVTNMSREMALDIYGASSVVRWKRSFHAALPSGECLEDLYCRAWACFEGNILPRLRDGLNALVVAETDAIRTLALGVTELPFEHVEALEFERGQVIAYSFDDYAGFKPGRPGRPLLRVVV